MPNYFREADETQIVGGGYGGYGGGGFGGGGFGSCFALIILVVIVLWLLFSRDKDGYGGGGNCNGGGYPVYPPYAPYPYPAPYGGSNCNSNLDCKIKMTPDMSNCEVDRDLWKVDADLLKCCCEEKEVTHMEGEKTRAVLYADKVEALRDKLAESNTEKAALKTQIYTDAKFDALNAKLSKEDCETDKQFAYLLGVIKDLKCEIDHCFPKLPPQWIDSITPDTHHADCHDFPRRRGFDKCGCNDECYCN